MTPMCLCLFILRMIYHDLKQESLPFIHVWYTLENIYVRGLDNNTHGCPMQQSIKYYLVFFRTIVFAQLQWCSHDFMEELGILKV